MFRTAEPLHELCTTSEPLYESKYSLKKLFAQLVWMNKLTCAVVAVEYASLDYNRTLKNFGLLSMNGWLYNIPVQ